MKLRTARKEGQVVAWKNKKEAQGDVPLGLGMFAGIPGCRTRACQCDLLEWWWLIGSRGCLGKNEWQVLEEGVSDWQRQGERRGIQGVSEDDRGQRPVDANVPIKTGK
jgi:hypothetical protein